VQPWTLLPKIFNAVYVKKPLPITSTNIRLNTLENLFSGDTKT